MIMEHVLGFLFLTAAATFRQIGGILGIFFLFGVLLFLLSRLTRNVFRNSRRTYLDMYVTGWIGTPVHELGHAVFCLLFRHTITDMKLYVPDSGEGSLGYVHHSYNQRSVYQRAGNFFIGAGPILFGTFILYMLMIFLLPNHQDVSGILSDRTIEGITLADVMSRSPLILSFSARLAGKIFSSPNLSSFSFWIFMYLSLCVSSHMGLSMSDLKGMGGGMAVIAAILFVMNAGVLLMKADVSQAVLTMNAFTARFMSVFIFAIFISTVNFVFSYVLLGILHFRKFGTLVRID